GDLLLEVAVRRRDHPYVHGVRAIVADSLVLVLLEHPQQLALQVERDLADLVEEDRAAVGQLEAAHTVPMRPRERALHVPEELAFEQLVRDRRAVDLDQRTLAARAARVDHVRDELLADARLALNQHARARLRDGLEPREHLLQGRAFADDAAEVHRDLHLLDRKSTRLNSSHVKISYAVLC